MLKNDQGESGFFSSNGNGVRIFGVNDSAGFPIPSKEIIAEFSDLESMIEAGWVID